MGRHDHSHLTADDVQAIYLSPAPRQEMAEEFRIDASLVSNIRHQRSYRRYTEGLPRPPFTDTSRMGPPGLPTEPLRRKHKRIPDPASLSQPDTKRSLICAAEVLTQCGERDASVFRLRVMENLPLLHIGKRFGLTRERIRTVCDGIIRRIQLRITHYDEREVNDKLWAIYAASYRRRAAIDQPLQDRVDCQPWTPPAQS